MKMTVTDRKNKFLEKNNKFAKDVVSRAFEVIIALTILLLQYINCNVPFFEGSGDESYGNSTSDISDDVIITPSTIIGEIPKTASQFWECVLKNLHLLEPLKWTGVAIAACSVIFASVVWVHSEKLNGMNVELTGNIYFN